MRPAIDVVSTFFNDFVEYVDGREYRRSRSGRVERHELLGAEDRGVDREEMYLYGGTAKEAWKRMIAYKHFRYPDLGIVFNV